MGRAVLATRSSQCVCLQNIALARPSSVIVRRISKDLIVEKHANTQQQQQQQASVQGPIRFFPSSSSSSSSSRFGELAYQMIKHED